jgi:methionyl aminopeptidase
MIIETDAQLVGLQASGLIVRTALNEMRKAVRAGISTLELNDIGAKVLADNGARSGPPLVYNYPKEVCISVNDEALHGIPSADRIIQDGDVVKLDLVAEKDGYFTDSALTVLVGKKAASLTALAVEEAFRAALTVVKPGALVNSIGVIIAGIARLYGCNPLKDFTGHGVGNSIHESPTIPNNSYPSLQNVKLVKGMVITIEPIIVEGTGDYVKSDDGWTIKTKDSKLASHHEHTLVVTTSGPFIVT